MQDLRYAKCLKTEGKGVDQAFMLELITRRIRQSKGQTYAERCKFKFLRFFPNGFRDAKYIAWERGYKEEAHLQWDQALNKRQFNTMLRSGRHLEIGQIATRIESKTNLLFSFEKMAFRDAVKSDSGAKLFSEGLYHLLYGRGSEQARFDSWVEAVGKLPRTKTRVLTHPVVTVFPFIAVPQQHIFLKPNVTRRAAEAYGFDFQYDSKPSWATYSSLLRFARQIKTDLKDLKPRNMIDIQSFIWVVGSDEYA